MMTKVKYKKYLFQNFHGKYFARCCADDFFDLENLHGGENNSNI